MKNLFCLLALLFIQKLYAQDITVVGKIPGEYLGATKTKTYLGKVVIKKGIILEVKKINSSEVKTLQASGNTIIAKTGRSYDVLYPGIIDLHNHTKQNILSAWDDAKGQFANRFEWRAWGNYELAVSSNMNPWIGYGKAITCAAFRWSELQAMTIGTTYLQGPSSCISDFAIHQVEDSKAFRSPKKGVQAPTDIVLPGEMVFVWNTLRPLIEAGATYEEALKETIHKYCPGLKDKIKDVNASADLKILGNQAALKKGCGIKTKEDEKKFPPKFVRYVYWIHKTVAGKKKYLEDKNAAAIVAHLAEGRREDPYNKLEFQILKLLGLDQKHVNLVHALGLEKKDYSHMAEQGMGLVWSPYSNFLLYGETADIKTAYNEYKKNGEILMSLGSDWTPTGSRGPLEELQIAREYIQKDPNNEGLAKIFTDEVLFRMLTENPARMINHYEDNPNDKHHGVGTLKPSAMGTLIALKSNQADPFKNFVTSSVKDVNLVVVDGKAQYGNEKQISQVYNKADYENIGDRVFPSPSQIAKSKIPVMKAKGTKASRYEHLVKMGEAAKKIELTPSEACNFQDNKVFVNQDSINKDKDLKKFYADSGLNLDRFPDILKLLGVGLLSQSRNINDPKKGKPEYSPSYMIPLHSCHDEPYRKRIANFFNPGSDEYTQNKSDREENRESFGSVPKRMADKYNEDYVQDDY